MNPGLAQVDDNFLTYPVGTLYGSAPCCIYHYSGVPIGTYVQTRSSSSYDHGSFAQLTQWRNDSLLQAKLVNWRYSRNTANNGFGWQTSTALYADLRHRADTSQTLWPATDVILTYKIVLVTYSAPSGTISGPTQITSNGTYTWTANAQGGSGSYAYTWDYSENAGASWAQLCAASLDPHCSRTVTTSNQPFILRAKISTYNGSSVSPTLFVSVGSAPPPLTITLSGPSSVRSTTPCLWTATPTSGISPFSYAWSVNSVSVNNNSSNPAELIYQNFGSNFTVRVSVTDAASASGTISKSVTISGAAPICPY